MTTTYQAGKAPSGAPWTWEPISRFAGLANVNINDNGCIRPADCSVECAEIICRAAHEAQVMRAALDTLYHVVGLTAIKYPGQLAALNEAVDVARAALAAQPEAGR